MMFHVDQSKCTKCGLCLRTCNWLETDEDGYPFLVDDLGCIECGHCVAVCPTEAISHDRLDAALFTPMVDPGISIDAFTNLVRNRRSIRNFKNEPVRKEDIDALLHCARFIPTGSNKQSLEYHVVTDPGRLQAIREFMAAKFKLTARLASIFRLFVSKEDRTRLQRQVDTYKSGKDPFLRNGPCLLVIHSRENYFGITKWDAGIASYCINLAAETLGLGVVMNGFFVTTCNVFGGLKKIAGLPGKTNVLAALVIGYPDIKYKRTVARKPLKVTWD